jgi:hypothetical protein
MFQQAFGETVVADPAGGGFGDHHAALGNPIKAITREVTATPRRVLQIPLAITGIVRLPAVLTTWGGSPAHPRDAPDPATQPVHCQPGPPQPQSPSANATRVPAGPVSGIGCPHSPGSRHAL